MVLMMQSVKFYGSSRDVVIRLATREGVKAEMLGNQVLDILQSGTGDNIDMRRIEFVGASVGDELARAGRFSYANSTYLYSSLCCLSF